MLAGKKGMQKALFLIGLTVVLTINYMCNLMDVQNLAFPDFQGDSETLVTGMFLADSQGIGETEYGLGRYCTKSGALMSRYGTAYTYLTDGNWTQGYSNSEPQILLDNNYYTRTYAVGGNLIRFANGESIPILSGAEDREYLAVSLASDGPLSAAQYGSLDEAVFLDREGRECPQSVVETYRSQYGLQGKLFRLMAKCLGTGMQEGEQTVFHLVCSAMTAFVFVLIVWLVRKKYGNLFAVCYYITFLLSPWIVNFAKNLYWVEFTWFIPMLAGLFCSIYIDDRKCRVISYVAVYLSLTVKSLCGYEYLSTIMLGMSSFLAVDLIQMLIKGADRKKAGMVFRALVGVGLCALAGFATAFVIHGYYRGGGQIWQGIQTIIREDAVRRTRGLDHTTEISLWYILDQYFHFRTEVITGIPGNLFVVICLIPVCIFIYDYRAETINWNDVLLYGVFFLTSVSWFCLAKNHAYVHTHMNYVLWYFGYVQICIYVIVKRFAKFCSHGPCSKCKVQG